MFVLTQIGRNVILTRSDRSSLTSLNVDHLAAVIARFPAAELETRRLYRQDAAFRGLCQDYEEALRALRHWTSRCGPAGVQTADYRRIVAELEAELEGSLAAG